MFSHAAPSTTQAWPTVKGWTSASMRAPITIVPSDQARGIALRSLLVSLPRTRIKHRIQKLAVAREGALLGRKKVGKFAHGPHYK